MIVHAQYLSMPIAVLNKSSLRLLYIYEPLKENIKEYYTEMQPQHSTHALRFRNEDPQELYQGSPSPGGGSLSLKPQG